MQVDIARLVAPTFQPVHREECTRCFDSQDGPLGIDLCLTCFNGSCPAASAHDHAQLHYSQSGHAIALNIRRTLKPKAPRDENEPPIKKLAIREDLPDSERYTFTTTPIVYSPSGSTPLELTPHLTRVIDGVMNSLSSAQKSEVKAWEEEIVDCRHTRECTQSPPLVLSASGLAACSIPGCGLTENLWLCLDCGTLSCGRQQFGGGGGNGHALLHTQTFEEGHKVAVKMGSLDAGGGADVYCYACDDAKLDPRLSEHLANFGIQILGRTKTEKSMTELQIEQNQKFDFVMTGEDGKSLVPLFGPGLTGLKNLGNSCYIASTLQTLFSLPAFRQKYLTSFLVHPGACTASSPAECLDCQMGKLAEGICSGRFSVPRVRPSRTEEEVKFLGAAASGEVEVKDVIFQDGIKPSMFKSLIGKNHEEFSTMKQQDAEEFFKHLLETLHRHERSTEDDLTNLFRFENEIRLECLECGGVRYRVEEGESVGLPVPIRVVPNAMEVDGKKEYESVTIEQCLELLTGRGELEYCCPQCDKSGLATQSTKFSTFPELLLVQARRFQLIGWVPQKVDVPLVIGDTLSMDRFQGKGLQTGEVQLPDSTTEEAPQVTVWNVESMQALTGMGFPEVRCQRALLATGNGGADEAMNWLFAHMEDPDIDDPLPTTAAAAARPEPGADAISSVVDMGFTPAQGRKALKETNNDVSRAVEWLFSHPDDTGLETPSIAAGAAPKAPHGSSVLPARYKLKAFISHKGPSVHSGHYVAHIRQEDGSWVLFNDEKVVVALEGTGKESVGELMKLAYVYLFEKI